MRKLHADKKTTHIYLSEKNVKILQYCKLSYDTSDTYNETS